MGIACIYLLLTAEYLALIQMSVYAGGVIVLFLFALMLTRSEEFMLRGSINWINNAIMAFILIGTFIVIVIPISQSFIGTVNPQQEVSNFPHGIAWVGFSLFNIYQIGFIILGILLVATLLGSIYLVKNEPEDLEKIKSSVEDLDTPVKNEEVS